MTKNDMLAAARVAYHQLHTGGMPRVVVDGKDGSRVEYTAVNKSSLYGYIQQLEAELGCAVGIPSGPARFTF